jgi:hypothetical protein
MWLEDNRRSHAKQSIQVRTTVLNGSSSCNRWETFTSNNVFSSFSIGTIKGFEGIRTSSAIIESSLASTKTKGVTRTIYYLHSKGVDAFILKIRVGVMCGSDGKNS